MDYPACLFESDYVYWQQRVLASYQRYFGVPLMTDEMGCDAVRCLFDAEFVLLSHRLADDPVFNYGNRAALSLFEFDWQGLTALPSRCSAEPVSRDERAALLARVARDGFIDDYSGVRISKKGKRFKIVGAKVWNVTDELDVCIGQAATFDTWQMCASADIDAAAV
ncbi:MAG: MEKHLA domain-containing protein [Pseudomonadales bacterium]